MITLNCNVKKYISAFMFYHVRPIKIPINITCATFDAKGLAVFNLLISDWVAQINIFISRYRLMSKIYYFFKHYKVLKAPIFLAITLKESFACILASMAILS